MADKWVDNTQYFGPDRRKRPTQKRWSDRRRYDETSDRPALNQMLRRLRVTLLGVSVSDDRKRIQQLFAAAITQAERQGFRRCAESLRKADQSLRLSAAINTDAADAHLIEAMDHCTAER